MHSCQDMMASLSCLVKSMGALLKCACRADKASAAPFGINWDESKLLLPCRETASLLLCSINFDPDTIRSRLRELAFLNSAATINFKASKASQAPTDGASQNSSRKALKNGKKGQAEVKPHLHHAERVKGQETSAVVTLRRLAALVTLCAAL